MAEIVLILLLEEPEEKREGVIELLEELMYTTDLMSDAGEEMNDREDLGAWTRMWIELNEKMEVYMERQGFLTENALTQMRKIKDIPTWTKIVFGL